MHVIRDIQYVPGGSLQQMLDLATPDTSIHQDKPPLIVYIHGGAWMHRDKADYTSLINIADSNHVAVAVLNYSLSPDHVSSTVHPIHINDVADAIAW
jgi:acetyl esterase/lipase